MIKEADKYNDFMQINLQKFFVREFCLNGDSFV